MVRQNLSPFRALRWFAIASLVAVWVHPTRGQSDSGMTFRGRILAENAEPLRDARVDIATAAPRVGQSIFCPSCYLDCQKWTRTDESGNFEISNLDSSLNFRLVVSAAGYQTIQTELIAPEHEPLVFQLEARPKSLDPRRVVSGLIRDEYGAAVMGASVLPAATIDSKGLRTFHANGVAPAVSDAEGNFEIDLVDGVEGIDVEILAEGWCGKKAIGLLGGDDRREVTLSAGFRIVGMVQRNGEPVAGLTLAVAQTNRRVDGENHFLQAIPAITDSAGRF